jgi:hypothetical protein
LGKVRVSKVTTQPSDALGKDTGKRWYVQNALAASHQVEVQVFPELFDRMCHLGIMGVSGEP